MIEINVVAREDYLTRVDALEATGEYLYVGYPTIFGNKWSHLSDSNARFQVETAEEAVESYRNWLFARHGSKGEDYAIKERDQLRTELNRIAVGLIAKEAFQQLSNPDQEPRVALNLLDWHASKPYHGDVIKEYLTYIIDAKKSGKKDLESSASQKAE